jgi:hypothetical protein
MYGQNANVSAPAWDAAVARPTVQGHFAVPVDTLIGIWLPSRRRQVKMKEVASPKFSLVDPGVARALAGRWREPLDGSEGGFLPETWTLHELRAAMTAQDSGDELHHRRTPSASEKDFFWTRQTHAVGGGVKAASSCS